MPCYFKLFKAINNNKKKSKQKSKNRDKKVIAHTHINITINNKNLIYVNLKKLFSTFVSSENILGVVYSSTIVL